MAVNKGEIGIYGVLRRDGGNGVLANTDQIYDNNSDRYQIDVNKDVHTISNEFIVDNQSIRIGSNSDNISLLPIGTQHEPLLYLSTTKVYIKNYRRMDLLRSDDRDDNCIYLGNMAQKMIVLSSDVQFNSISFGNNSCIYLGANDTLQLGNYLTPCELFINEDGSNITLSSSINNIKYNISMTTRNIVELQERCESVEHSITNLVDNVSTELNKKYDSTISRTQNTVLAAPSTGDGSATFRKLVLDDIPDLKSKYQVLDSNGYQIVPQFAGAVSGYTSSVGYIKASIPSGRNEKQSSTWYYATDGSLQDINDSVTRLKVNQTIEDLNIQIDATNYPKGYIQLNPYNNYSANAPEVSIYNNNSVMTYYIGSYGSSNGYGYQIAQSHYGNIFYRKWEGASYRNWKQFAFTDSNITGNSATATKLKTPVTLWGQSFDGSSNITGNLSIGASKLTFGTSDAYYQFIVGTNGLLLGKYTNSDMVVFAPQGTYFGGVSAPTEKVEVNGNVKAKEYLLSDGSKYAEACLESDITALFN